MRNILFLCLENRARSQIAEGLARHFLGHQGDVFSAGSEPADKIHPMAVAVMAEIGIDISAQKPKALTAIDLHRIDAVIVLCKEQECPVLPKNIKIYNWPISQPVMKNISPEDQIRKFRKVRDEIRKRVLALRSADQTY